MILIGLLVLPVHSDAQEAEDSAAQTEPAASAGEPDKDGDDTADYDTESTVDEDTAAGAVTVQGDIRPLLNYVDRTDRNGVASSDAEVRSRYRIGGAFAVGDSLRLGARLAGRCNTNDCGPEWYFDRATPSTSGLNAGQVTLDELYAHFYKSDRLDVTLGRQQSRFVLRSGVFARSLDRNDGNNVNVTWTDGLHAKLRSRGGWATHFILQRNSDEGTGNARRSPLDFSSSSAKSSYFVGLENTTSLGNIVQRSLDVSYMPSSLLKDGTLDGRVEDYWAVVGRLAMRWPQRPDGPRLRAGIEVGYAPEKPTAAAVELQEEVDGLAWDVALSFMDFRPAHSIGINYSRTGAAWLISPNFRPNEEMFEIRYQWRPANFPAVEFRTRWRTHIEQETGASQKREVFDSFLRITWQFSLLD